jgi:uncharacterized protein (DUF342 family)
LLFLSTETLVAQVNDDITRYITNDSRQKWRLSKIEGKPENECDNNQSYEFVLAGRTAIKVACGRTESWQWAISTNQYKKYITFSQLRGKTNYVYEIQVLRKDSKVLLRLRNAAINTYKETTDYYFEKVEPVRMMKDRVKTIPQ